MYIHCKRLEKIFNRNWLLVFKYFLEYPFEYPHKFVYKRVRCDWIQASVHTHTLLSNCLQINFFAIVRLHQNAQLYKTEISGNLLNIYTLIWKLENLSYIEIKIFCQWLPTAWFLPVCHLCTNELRGLGWSKTFTGAVAIEFGTKGWRLVWTETFDRH